MSDTLQAPPPASPQLTGRVRQSWKITYPLIVATISPTVLAIADTVMLGWYSTEALATISLVLPIYVFAMALLVPWGSSIQILVSRWKGAGEHARINRMLDTGLLFCLAIGVGASLLLLTLAPLIVRLLSGGNSLPASVAALQILMLCLPFAAVTTAYRGVFGGLGETGIAMRVALLVNLTNIPATYVLVFGFDLGVIGSATGTLLATSLGMVYIIWFGRRKLGLEYTFWKRANLRRPREIVNPLSRIGWPEAIMAGSVYAADILIVSIVAYLGDVSLAGYRIMIITVTVLWVVVFSASSGISILAGQRLGAGDVPGALAFRRSGAILMTGMATLAVLPPLINPNWFFGLFTADTAVVAEATSVVYILLAMAPAMVFGMSMAGVLRAAGDTKSVMYAAIVGQVAFGLPIAWLCAVHFDMGLIGVYYGLLAAQIARTVITYAQFRSGKWRESSGKLD
ncbi:MATE family efflux transporter [Natronoglycomyces albus]|uniref:Probable multidrug resistance protein NorM n=1 Tax=Natronoglycomyces albus TaxID=2811108 RepID=A0A895XNQ4_9ACTN|nr:MATE family efflux transporter [Natronoglycomyces albus]QSB05173.1 MATE family efflux transporter [Natronoglycomyces albus]